MATQDGSDGWWTGCYLKDAAESFRLRCQQGSGEAIFLAGVTGNELNGDWRIAVGGKMNSPTNIEFLKIDIHLWRKKNFDSQKFMQSSSSILLSQPLLKLAKLELKITDL